MTDQTEFNEKYAEIERLAGECLDLLVADEANVIPIDGPVGKVQYFAHLRDYHGWDGMEWLVRSHDDDLTDIHDAEHENAAVTGPVGIEDLVVPHTHPVVPA